MHLARKNQRTEVVQALTLALAIKRTEMDDAHVPMGSRLCAAAASGRIDITEELLSKGCEPTPIDKDGSTFFHAAARADKYGVLEQFLSNADFASSLRCNCAQWTGGTTKRTGWKRKNTSTSGDLGS